MLLIEGEKLGLLEEDHKMQVPQEQPADLGEAHTSAAGGRGQVSRPDQAPAPFRLCRLGLGSKEWTGQKQRHFF